MSGWFQRTVSIKARKRGCHLITDEIVKQVPEIKSYSIGLCHLFLKHTSASITLNENCDSDVRLDMEDSLNRMVPEGKMYRHDAEGPDDMPAHVKSSLMGCSLSIPITSGRLQLGTWQGVWLNEHRDHGGSRNIVVTLQGDTKSDKK